MSTTHARIAKTVLHEPATKPYTTPLLTRCGTVEELTQTDGTSTGSGIHDTDATVAGAE